MIEGAVLLFGSPAALAALLGGTLLGLVFGVLPGVSGRTGLILMAPLMIGADPLLGSVFLIALHAIVHTSGSIPAILVGIPTSSAEAATVLDGYALTRRGRADIALGVSLAASAAGGCVGAVALVAMIHVFRPIIGAIGQPEILVLAVTGLAMVASLSGTRVAAGVAAAAFGLLAGCVGMDPASGTPRFVLGMLELWDGLDIPALVTGLFVVPELMSAAPRGTAHASGAQAGFGRLRGVMRGMAAVWRRPGLLLRTSTIGIVVGLIPGMGAAIAVWLAYGHAAQSDRSRIPYGRGALGGVLAPEAANNSKEGGALAPTLFLGIPGSSSMAILIAAFAGMGLRPGSAFLDARVDLTHALALTIVAANLVAVPLCIAGAPLLARLTVHGKRVIPVLALCAAVASAVYATPFASTLLQLALFGALGCAMREAGWPRAPLVLGFVVGPVAEGALQKTVALYGVELLLRPGVLLGLVIIGAALAFGFRRRTARDAEPGARRWDLGLATGAIALGITALLRARGFPAVAGLLPIVAGAVLAAAGALALIRAWRHRPEPASAEALARHAVTAVLGAAGLLIGGSAVIGLPAATAVASFVWLTRREKLPAARAGGVALGVAATLFILLTLGDARPPLLWGWLLVGES